MYICVSVCVCSSFLCQVLDDPSHFTLCMVYDNGRKETCDKDYPLLARLRAGPDERVAKLFIVESDSEVGINVSAEVSGREQGKSCNYSLRCRPSLYRAPLGPSCLSEV